MIKFNVGFFPTSKAKFTSSLACTCSILELTKFKEPFEASDIWSLIFGTTASGVYMLKAMDIPATQVPYIDNV